MEIIAYDAAHCQRYRTFNMNPQRDDPRAIVADFDVWRGKLRGQVKGRE
jgi:hypothetical protein